MALAEAPANRTASAKTSGNFTLTSTAGLWAPPPSCFNRENPDGTESAVLHGARGTHRKTELRLMKTIAYLTLVGGLALACAGLAFAGPIGDGAGEGGTSDSFTPPPPPPLLGQDVANYINSLPADPGDAATTNSYDTSAYMPKPTDGLGDLQISWNDIVGLTTGAYDQYWMTHTAPPPQPLFQPMFFSAPTGNLGESDAAGEGYMFSVTARNIKFVALIPEPMPLLLLGIGIAAMALARRRIRS